jgi:uncharacterized integral membrane protein
VLRLILVPPLVFAVFGVQHTAPVAVSFLGWQAEGVAVSVLALPRPRPARP